MIPLVSVVTFLPGLAGLALLLVPQRADRVLRPAALGVAVVTFLLSLPLYFGFDAELIGYQFEEHGRWMPTLGASYHVGIDGISLLLVLVAILALYHRYGGATGRYTFDLPVLAQYVMAPGRAQDLMFLAFALAFAIKVPLFPFHTGLPDAHVEAPTAGSVILAGVLLKMGTYGFLRFCLPLFPDASLAFGPLVFTLAVIGVIYGAWVSTVQPDMKKLVAYSSVSHLGFVMLGIFTLNQQGLVGGLIQMVNHGLSTGALFLMVGMIYERRHSRLIADFGGLWQVVPAFSALFLVVALSSLGLPGLNGFVG